MTYKKLYLTVKNIESIEPPEKGKRVYYQDTKVPCLFLMVTGSGNKSFSVYRKVNYRPVRVTIGKYPYISIENARKQAQIIISELVQGVNPNEKKRMLNSEMKFNELFNEFLEKHSKRYKKTWKEDENLVNRLLRNWLNRKISSISKDEVRQKHEQVRRKNGLHTANRLLACIRSIYNRGIEWGLECENPAIGIKPFPEKSRSRFLLPDEFPRFIKSLAKEYNTIARDYFFVSIFTGARRANVLSMKWKDIDFHMLVWRIPETKNGESHVVPLTQEVVDVLRKRMEENPELGFRNSKYVFPGTGKKGHLVEPKKAWKRILERAEIEDLRIHDLRRTFGSWQASTGANSYVIGKSLGHKSQQATAIYARLNIEPVRESVEKATAAMLATLDKDNKQAPY